MFTGIVDHCGKIVKISNELNGKKVWISTLFEDLMLGESIAVDGICLTVAEIASCVFCCDISPETLERTRAHDWCVESTVNLERALRLQDRLSGHFVNGHIDQICQIKSKMLHQDFMVIEFIGVTSRARQFLIEKGSITVNGVSLTINRVFADGFEVMLIPHTLSRTNLLDLQAGQSVNIEYDLLNKMVINHLKEHHYERA